MLDKSRKKTFADGKRLSGTKSLRGAHSRLCERKDKVPTQGPQGAHSGAKNGVLDHATFGVQKTILAVWSAVLIPLPALLVFREVASQEPRMRQFLHSLPPCRNAHFWHLVY